MTPLFRAAVDVQRFWDNQGWKFCFIGPRDQILVSPWRATPTKA